MNGSNQTVTPVRRTSDSDVRRAGDWLREARENQRAGCVAEAIAAYEKAVAAAEQSHEAHILAEALRRLSVVLFHRDEAPRAHILAQRSYEIAHENGHAVLAAEALNVIGGFEFEGGHLATARASFHRALALGGSSAELRSRIDRNLGILANIQGDLSTALAHYERSLEACRAAGDEHGCALALHNLGMVSADRNLWDDADRFFSESFALAEQLGDLHLQGLCLLNHAEVHLGRQRYDQARRNAEGALAIFDQLGNRLDKADAYKVLGMVYRDTGRVPLAESRLRAAIELAVGSGSVLSEAEASRELAKLFQQLGRNREALTLLNAAYRLFDRLEARHDLGDVAVKRAALEATFLAVVRDWGQSIESADSYTFGHCERVADYAVAVARALGLDASGQKTVRLGAYLHDLGKVKVPHEILNKPGPLTREEFEVMQMHPVWGVELLEGIEFPWDIVPMIRWHHEKYDGSGYPDRLKGDEIPVEAQVIGIVDVYDALTTTRSYRPAHDHAAAMEIMWQNRHWWRADIFEAFLRSVGATGRVTAEAA